MHDAESALQPARPGEFRQLAHADDALLMARTAGDLDSAAQVGQAGHALGQALITTCPAQRARSHAGGGSHRGFRRAVIPGHRDSSDGRASAEMTRRIGMALAAFRITMLEKGNCMSYLRVTPSGPSCYDVAGLLCQIRSFGNCCASQRGQRFLIEFVRISARAGKV